MLGVGKYLRQHPLRPKNSAQGRKPAALQRLSKWLWDGRSLSEHHFGKPAPLKFRVWESGTLEREQDAGAVHSEGAPTFGRLRAHKTLVLAGLRMEGISLSVRHLGEG